MSLRLLIDTDTASDDAVALLMAFGHPAVTVEAVTVVAGNVPLAQGVQNALYVRDLAGADVPVYVGREGPRVGALITAQDVHGEDGMGDIGLDLQGRLATPGDAVDVLIERIRASPGELTLVTLGPLTNVAEAFERAPDLPGLLDRVVVMGGTSDAVGNVTAVAEYNIWVDPEAAAVVFGAGAPLVMVGWDISRKHAVFGAEETAWLRGLGPLGAFSADIQRVVDAFARAETKLVGFDLPDPIAMAVALDPTVATQVERLHVEVEVDGTHTRGQTVVDRLGVAGGSPNVDVVVEASQAGFERLLALTLGAGR